MLVPYVGTRATFVVGHTKAVLDRTEHSGSYSPFQVSILSKQLEEKTCVLEY